MEGGSGVNLETKESFFFSVTPEKLQEEPSFSLVTPKEEDQLDEEDFHPELVTQELQLNEAFFSVTPEEGLDQLETEEVALVSVTPDQTTFLEDKETLSSLVLPWK